MKQWCFAAFCLFIWVGGTAANVAWAQLQFDLGTAVLSMDEQGRVTSLVLQDGSSWPVDDQPMFCLETAQARRVPTAVTRVGERLLVQFQGGSQAEFLVRTPAGQLVCELTSLETADPQVQLFRLFHLPIPPQADIAGPLNACSTKDWSVAVLGAAPNVLGQPETSGGTRGDRAGCTHTFVQVADLARVGQYAARFTATCDDQPGGWSVRGKRFAAPLDLTGCLAIRAWVHGDGQGELLKIQLYDGAGGYRDIFWQPRSTHPMRT